MHASTRRRLAGLVALPTFAAVPLWLAVACGGPAKPPTTAAGSASASASVPLFTQSSGASPIHVAWKAGACDVEMRDGLGATYQVGDGAASQVEPTLQQTADACLNVPKGTQGTLYVEAKVAASGALSDVVVSPGGAVSTEVVQCMTKAFGQARLPAPKNADSVLLLFVVSACPPP